VAAKLHTSLKQASIAKITRPNTYGILLRKRLFDIIDKSTEFPVIFITSPPGSGKTSLIASYLENQKIPCLWYSIDEGDKDIATFFHYMRLAAQYLSPGKKKPLPSYTPDYAYGVSVFARLFFENLFSRVRIPFFLVFDNYQNVPVNSRFHEMLTHGLSNIPVGINVLIASRKEPPPPFARMYVYDKARVLGWDTIRFTLEEAKCLIEKKLPGGLQGRAIQSLYEKTDGWVSGLILYLKSIRHEDLHNQLTDRLSSKSIFEYFAKEVLQKEDKDTRKFLFMTAFLPMMTVKMAERLTGNRSTEKILEDLSKECCFIETFAQDKTIYRYHQLFREFLLSRGAASLGKNILSLVKYDAAVLLEEAGNAEDAVQLLKESGDVERLIPVIQKWAPSMVRQGRYQTLIAWLEIIPGEVLLNHPWLLYWRGICRLPFQPDESQSLFEKAFERFSSQREVSGAFLSWSGIVESIMYGREGLKPLDSWLPVIDKLLKDFNGFPSGAIETDVTCSVFRVLSLRKPLHYDTGKWLPRIHAIAQKSADVSQKISALTSLAQYLYSCGEFRSLEIVLGSLNDLLQRHEVPPLTRLTVDWLRAAFYNAMSLYNECLQVVSEGLELAQNLKIKVMEYMLLGHGVLSLLKQGNLSHANQYLQKMASALSLIKPWEAGFYHYCAAWVDLYQKNVGEALTHSEHCLKIYKEIGNPWTLTIAQILRAYVFHASGDTKKAMNCISEAHSLGIQTKNVFTPFMCSLSEAYFYLEQGKEESALKVIRKGLHIGKENGFVNLFMWPKGVMERVLTEALDHDIEEDYVKQLVRSNDLIPDRHHANGDRWPWPIKIYTLGRFGLLKDEKPVQFTGKIQQKPLALLKALIAFGGREVSEERLSDILWPEADGDKAHNAFTTTLSRLRQFLGEEKVIGFHEGKAMLDPRYCYVDVWAFERLLGEASSFWDKGYSGKEKEDAVKLSQRAIKMYTGSFLGGENEPWMVSIRERLRNKVLRMIKRCGSYYEESGALEDALECYQKGLEVDDLIEEFYQRMMKCYYRLGKRAEALSVYKRCSQVLSSVLGIDPSAETEALAREMKR
jgi:ATP/maltotriose-dependent transcriptional regulator MalT/two-component SAPR family response regulator